MNIRDFHVQNNYYVQVIPIKNTSGCIVTFPNNVLLGQESIISHIVTFGYQWNVPYIIPFGLEIIGLGLCLIGAYLLFKFKIKSGNVIWVGRI